MMRERLTRLSHGCATGTVLAARALHAVGDHLAARRHKRLVARIRAYGFQTQPVSRVVCDAVAAQIIEEYRALNAVTMHEWHRLTGSPVA